MSLRPRELELLAAEVDRELEGAVVQKVSAPTASRVYLELRVPGRSVTLLACAEPGVARLSAVDARPANPPTPPGWQAVLRRELIGARLRDGEALPARRTLLLHVDAGPADARRPLTLVLEVGAEPLVALVNHAGRVLALSTPARAGLRVGATWSPLDERATPAQPSRLASDRVHLRLAHGAEALFAAREQQRWADAQRAPLASTLRRLERTRDKVRADLARAEQADTFRREGALLAQHLHRLERGLASVSLLEYREDGSTGEVHVALDPRRTPREEVDWRFHQYRRLQRGALLARARLAAIEADLAAARSDLERLAEAPPAAPAEAVLRRPRSSAQAPLPPYREYLGHGGQRIWVGRGARHNDALTFRVARPFHVWFHARGVPGAHVVVPLDKREQLSSEVMLDAAHLALHHSDLKGEPRGEVSYTPVKFVRKAKDAAPGAVTYTREKTVLLRLEPERLARLLTQPESR
jgi:predicted ribosome quality control (RQC) complex YloA/Tae2 family protein